MVSEFTDCVSLLTCQSKNEISNMILKALDLCSIIAIG